MMVVQEQGDSVTFLGSSFLVHPHGFLLTAAHLVQGRDRLLVAPASSSSDFIPMTFDRLAAMPVTIHQCDVDHDIALLRIDRERPIGVPDDFIGSAEEVVPGTSVVVLGFSFGHQQLHQLVALSGIISSKLYSRNHTKLLFFDTMVHEGDRGAPLVNAHDGRIIGLVSGRLDPSEVVAGSTEWSKAGPMDTNVSYAVVIDYGVELMRAEGLI